MKMRDDWVRATAVLAFLLLPAFVCCGQNAGESWTMYRGLPSQTGVAGTVLPEKLAILWRVPLPDGVLSTAAITKELVFIGCDDGHLYALSTADGSIRWKYAANTPIQSSPTVHDGMVLFGDEDGVVHAVKENSGEAVWTFTAGGQVVSAVNVTKDRAVVGSYDGNVYCLNVKDGSLIWKYVTQGQVHGTPALVDEFVIIAGCDEGLHVVALDSGALVREVPLGAVTGASAAVYGPQAVVGTHGDRVVCVDWKQGTVSWTFEDKERAFPFVGSAAILQDIAVIGGRDKRIRGLSLNNGKELWQVSTKARIESSPVIAGTRVFLPSADGILYELDLQTGRERWRFELGGGVASSPAIGHRMVVIANSDGVVYALGAK